MHSCGERDLRAARSPDAFLRGLPRFTDKKQPGRWLASKSVKCAGWLLAPQSEVAKEHNNTENNEPPTPSGLRSNVSRTLELRNLAGDEQERRFELANERDRTECFE